MIAWFFNWLMRTRVYNYLLKSVIPYIRFTTYYTPLRGNKYHEGYKILLPGDVILTDDSKKLTSILIKGTWSHVAVCVEKGPDCEYEIAEMTHNNFTKSWFVDIWKESSRIRIKRNPKWSDGYIMQVSDKIKSFHDKVYDNQFENSDNEHACVETLTDGDFNKTLNIKPTYMKMINRSFITPDNIDECPDLITVWDSHEIN